MDIRYLWDHKLQISGDEPQPRRGYSMLFQAAINTQELWRGFDVHVSSLVLILLHCLGIMLKKKINCSWSQQLFNDFSHACADTHTHTHTRKHTGMHANMHIYIHTHTSMQEHTNTHRHSCLHTHIHTHTHTHTHKHTHAQTNSNMHTHRHTHDRHTQRDPSQWSDVWVSQLNNGAISMGLYTAVVRTAFLKSSSIPTSTSGGNINKLNISPGWGCAPQ